MLFALLIVALLGTASCHTTRNYDASGHDQYGNGNAQYGNDQNGNAQYGNGNAQYGNNQNGNAQYGNGNAQYGNGNEPAAFAGKNEVPGNEPAAFAGMNEVPGNVEYINLSTFTNTSVRAAASSADCKDVGFDIDINEIKGTVALKGQWCSPGEDNVEWALTVGWTLKVFGIQLLNDKFHFNPRFSEVHRTLHLGVAKADIKLGVYNYCIKIIGEACYWAGKWRCGDIYEVPHCFKSQRFYSAYLRSNTARFIESDDCPSRMRQIAALAQSDEL